MPNDIVRMVAELAPLVAMLLVALVMLRASRSRVSQALVAAIVGLSLAIALGFAGGRIPASHGAAKSILILVQGVSISMFLLGFGELATRLGRRVGPTTTSRQSIAFGAAFVPGISLPPADSRVARDRVCPHCGGLVYATARVCRHCELDLPRSG